MAPQTSQTTTDHDTIRRWAEERGGKPGVVRGTGDGGAGVLRIWFPDVGPAEDTFEELSWLEFFQEFEENDLALVYQEETAEGDESRFAKLTSRGS